MLEVPEQPVLSLAPPGAGLPAVELFIARLLLGWKKRRSTRASATILFAREREAILTLARGCEVSAGRRRVLIPRPAGLEDCSRYWSVFMTLDHLRIVNHGTGELIRLLGTGGTPTRVTGTADVKPTPDADEHTIGAFEQACAHFERCVAKVADLRATPRWPHPWFGPLNAAEWHFFTAFHMTLHRRQIETILRLSKADPA